MALHLEHLSACHKQQSINFIYGTPSAKIILTELYSLCTATHNCNLFSTCARHPVFDMLRPVAGVCNPIVDMVHSVHHMLYPVAGVLQAILGMLHPLTVGYFTLWPDTSPCA